MTILFKHVTFYFKKLQSIKTCILTFKRNLDTFVFCLFKKQREAIFVNIRICNFNHIYLTKENMVYKRIN